MERLGSFGSSGLPSASVTDDTFKIQVCPTEAPVTLPNVHAMFMLEVPDTIAEDASVAVQPEPEIAPT